MRVCPQCERQYGDDVDFCAQDGARLRDVEDESEDPMIGRVLEGRWRIDEKFGEGGMGAIYVATQQRVGRKVAIKTLRAALSESDEFVDRFMQEARVTTDISHPHCVTIHDFGQTDNGILFLAMEFLEGQPLSERMNAGRIGVKESLEIGAQVSSALAAAHERNIIHRDLKPDNIFLLDISDGSTFTKVLDFGISKDLDSDKEMTQTGQLFGTPKYMSPEQCRGEELDGRSDLYSLGCILYAMLTGRAPFEGEKSMNILVSHVQKDIKPFSEVTGRQIPAPVEELVMRLLEKEPDDRPESATVVRKRIEQLLTQLEGWDENRAQSGAGSAESSTGSGDAVPTGATQAADWEAESGAGPDIGRADTAASLGGGEAGGAGAPGSGSHAHGGGGGTGPGAQDPLAAQQDDDQGRSPGLLLAVALTVSLVFGSAMLVGAYYMYTSVSEGGLFGGGEETQTADNEDGAESGEDEADEDTESSGSAVAENEDSEPVEPDTATASDGSEQAKNEDAGAPDVKLAQVDNASGTGGSGGGQGSDGQGAGGSASATGSSGGSSGTTLVKWDGSASSGTSGSGGTSGSAATSSSGGSGGSSGAGSTGSSGSTSSGASSGSTSSSSSSSSSSSGSGSTQVGSTGGGSGGSGGSGSTDKPEEPKVRPSEYVRISRLSASGAACRKSDVRRKLQAAQGPIGQCFVSAVEKNPGLSGDLMLDWRILTDGSTLDASVIKGSLSHGGARSCVVRAVKQVRFAPPSGGRCYTRVTFDFRAP